MRGLTLFTVDETFPGVGSSLEMIKCTRYIMFKEEFENCRDAVDKKKAIDDFWLGIGGSQERAKELLRRYYGRVKEANKLYSSYTQGWKSDRGMIFIVLGPPANTFRNKNNEVWVYGNDANPNALRFIFNRTENPFSDNDYIMERSIMYKDSYHTAVEYWRQGLVYFDNNKR
jgi:GWxTD domain-containing protein